MQVRSVTFVDYVFKFDSLAVAMVFSEYRCGLQEEMSWILAGVLTVRVYRSDTDIPQLSPDSDQR